MSETDNAYELKVLRMVINQHLDNSTALTVQSLNALETKRDQFVWNIATSIYSQSGYKVELSLVRDIVNSRITILKKHLAEEARRVAEQKAKQEAEEARQIAERKAKQQETEEAERKAKQEAEEARQAIEANPQILAKCKDKIFAIVRQVVSEQLSVDEAKVTLNSHLFDDLSADPLDIVELVMALEEELEIEINDEAWFGCLDVEMPDLTPVIPSFNFSFFGSSKEKVPTPPRFEGKVGKQATISNVVELIWDNAPRSSILGWLE